VTRFVAFVLVLLATLTLSRGAHAHKPSDSYLTLVADGSRFDVRWDIAVRDLDYALGVDGNGDGNVTWGELRARRDAVVLYASSGLTLTTSAGPCALAAQDMKVARHSDGTYASLTFAARCPDPTSPLLIDYSLLFDVDPQHRGLAQITSSGETRALVFTSQHRHEEVSLTSSSPSRSFGRFVVEGSRHIAQGIDHLLFLIALLLPAVVRRDGKVWTPVTGLRPALVDVLRVVTAFTVAHSITLSLAALEVVVLPARFVESAIAASVVLAALNNLFPILRADRWIAAFALGLLHGFGFSAALQDLGLARGDLLVVLFGFNLGVEVGQCGVVAIFLPIAYALRTSRAYRTVALGAGSIAITLVASVWLVERAFAVRLFP
jgi:hypothetical protein